MTSMHLLKHFCILLFLLQDSISKMTSTVTSIAVPASYSAWTLDNVKATSKGIQIMELSNSGTKMTLMVDGQRIIEDSRANFIELNLATQTGFASKSSDNQLYGTSVLTRNSLTGYNVTAVSSLFSIGKWTALTSSDSTKTVVINTRDSLNTTTISATENCSKILRTKCTNGGTDKIYCLETNDAGSETFLTYYSMPSCEKLKYTARIVRTFDANTLQTISAQGQLLSICSTSKTSMAAKCDVYDLNNSLFVLDNPDQSTPIKTLQLSLANSVTEILSFRFVLEWACAFYTATTTSSTAWNVFYKCLTDSVQGSILTADGTTPAASVAVNTGGLTVAFKQSSNSLSQLQFTKTEDISAPANCDLFNTEIAICYSCAPFTSLLKDGSCTDPVKTFVPNQYFDVSINMHVLTFQFKDMNQTLASLLTNNTNVISMVYFSNPDVLLSYNMQKISSDQEFSSHNRIRIRLWPNQSLNHMETNVGIKINGYVKATSRMLQATTSSQQNFSSVLIPPYYYFSSGQQTSFQILFDHLYTLVFMVKVYLIIVRPWVEQWQSQQLHMWLTHFVLSMQTLFLFGLNSLSLKGMANQFFLNAAMSSLRFISWDPVPQNESAKAFEYFQGGVSIGGIQPAFIQELTAFVVIYTVGFIGGVVSPYFTKQLNSIRTAALLCYMPQVWFMFFTGALNMLLGEVYTLLNYFSFAFSIILILVIIVDTLQLILGDLREKLTGLFGNMNQGIIIVYDVVDYYDKIDKVPKWYHIEIFLAILTGTILSVTFNSPLTQSILLLLIHLPGPLVYYYQFRLTTNRRVTKFKFAASIALSVFYLIALILHTKQQGIDSVAVMAVLMMAIFVFVAILHIGTLALRVVALTCGPQVILNAPEQAAPGSIVVDGAKRETTEGNNASAIKLANSILDRYLNPDPSKANLNVSKNDSEVHVRMLDNSVSGMR